MWLCFCFHSLLWPVAPVSFFSHFLQFLFATHWESVSSIFYHYTEFSAFFLLFFHCLSSSELFSYQSSAASYFSSIAFLQLVFILLYTQRCCIFSLLYRSSPLGQNTKLEGREVGKKHNPDTPAKCSQHSVTAAQWRNGGKEGITSRAFNNNHHNQKPPSCFYSNTKVPSWTHANTRSARTHTG